MMLAAGCVLVLATGLDAGQDTRAGTEIGAPDRAGERKSSLADSLQPVAVPEPSARAMQFYRTGNWLWAFNQFWAILVTGTLAFSGASARLRTLSQRIAGNWFFTIDVYIIMYLAIVFLVNLPLAYYQGFVRLHAYDLSNQTLAKWLRDTGIRLGVAMSVAFAFTWVPYLVMARSPRRWWLYMAIVYVPFLFATMIVQPIWIDPLFNEFGPMKDKALERSILSLADRAGIEGSRVFEVAKSVDTKAINAYVTGVFGAKRIVLWDTLTDKLEEPELLSVMGHEMGHYVLGHVPRSILLGSLLVLAALFTVDRLGQTLIARFSDRLGFDRLCDVASVPLLLMLIEVAFLILSPIALAYSRWQEHEADRFSLDLTRSNHAAAVSFVKMQAENLSNPRPGLLYTIFRASHPSISERIEFCNLYHPWVADQPVATRRLPAVPAE
jgi:Zn-dependent protease with chaperone function